MPKPSAITVFLERLEQDPMLGELASVLKGPVGAVLGSGPLSAALRGRPLGHALHPLMVQVPLGALLSASVLDLAEGGQAGSQSRLLMGVASLAAVPSALSGWAEWAGADDRTQRVGVAHAALNGVAPRHRWGRS